LHRYYPHAGLIRAAYRARSTMPGIRIVPVGFPVWITAARELRGLTGRGKKRATSSRDLRNNRLTPPASALRSWSSEGREGAAKTATLCKERAHRTCTLQSRLPARARHSVKGLVILGADFQLEQHSPSRFYPTRCAQ